MTNQKTVAVEYIGRRELYVDRLYKSGLTFTKGQVREVPELLSRKFLRHRDVFAMADADEGDDTQPMQNDQQGDVEQHDDTQQQLEDAQKQADQQQKQDENRQGIIDQVMVMEKDALTDFAHTNYQQKLDKRKSVETLRIEVSNFVDQFGVV